MSTRTRETTPAAWQPREVGIIGAGNTVSAVALGDPQRRELLISNQGTVPVFVTSIEQGGSTSNAFRLPVNAALTLTHGLPVFAFTGPGDTADGLLYTIATSGETA
jgi:hypothetical protein